MSTHDRCLAWLRDICPDAEPRALHWKHASTSPPPDSAVALLSSTACKRKRDSMKSPNLDPENTPKPRKRIRDMDVLDDSQSTTTGSSKKSRPSSPSKSPSKQVNLLRIADVGVRSRPLDDEAIAQLPPSIGLLHRDILRSSRGFGVVPASLRQQLRTQYPNEVVWMGSDVWKTPQEGEAQKQSDTEPTIDEMKRIVREAEKCKSRADSEAGWNSHCHGQTLSLATSLSRHHRQLSSVNITSAKLIRRLVPNWPGGHAGGKMVDFGIYLEETEKLQHATRYIRAEDDGSKYFNHTPYEPIAFKPLAISIETKKEGVSLQEAEVQLSVWAQAHFRRLVELRQRPQQNHSPLFLPLMELIGPHWYYLLAEGVLDKATGELKEVLVSQRILIGGADDMPCSFRILAVLLRLLDWVEEIYRPWFEAWVTPGPAAALLPHSIPPPLPAADVAG